MTRSEDGPRRTGVAAAPAADPLSIVVLTDPHIVPAGETLYGLDPSARLRAAVATVNRDHADASLVLILGDLAHHASPAAYRALQDALADLRAPAALLMGNHDRRGPFREVFPGADRDPNGFVQSLRVFEAASVLTLDTLDEEAGASSGLLCAERLDFLRQALVEAPRDRPLILAQHHPAAALGAPAMDAIRLANPDALWAAFEQAGRRPDLMLHGHLHRPFSGTWRGAPFHIQRGLSHQMDDAVTAGGYPGSHEPPDLSVLRVSGGDVVIHQRSFLYDGPRFSLVDPEAAQGRI